MARQRSSGAFARFGIARTAAAAPITVPMMRYTAFETVAPTSGCAVMYTVAMAQ